MERVIARMQRLRYGQAMDEPDSGPARHESAALRVSGD